MKACAKWILVTILVVAFVMMLYMFIFQNLLPLSMNPKTSKVISTLNPIEGKPLIGFWKSAGIFHQFGVAIDKVDDSLYSVSFCGPGGCFDPGKWTENTPIHGDPKYRLIDSNAIEIQGPKGISRYIRKH